MYVDDFVTGCSTTGEANKFIKDTVTMMNHGGFEIVKWHSNDESVFNGVDDKLKGTSMSCTAEERRTKVLGVPWNLHKDTLGVAGPGPLQENLKIVTKRAILQRIAMIYDPLGLVAPFTMLGKSLIQKIWKGKAQWDDPVSYSHEQLWRQWEKSIKWLQKVEIPRIPLGISEYNVIRTELHVFGDASFAAYGAVAYLRFVTPEKAYCRFVLARSRVAPLKQSTTPRLELMAAVLASRVARFALTEMTMNVDSITCWTDSQITLARIRAERQHADVFVRNRVNTAVQMVNRNRWSYCPTSQNPADIISRGRLMERLVSDQLWWTGPPFLSQAGDIGTFEEEPAAVEPEVVVVAATQPKTIVDDSFTDRMSPGRTPLKKLIPVTAWLLRFVANLRRSAAGESLIKQSMLNVSELKDAELFWIKRAQMKVYEEFYGCLRNNKVNPRRSDLANLNPYVDQAGLMRVGGRIGRADILEAGRHPIILPRQSSIAHRIAERMHVQCLHAGSEHVLSALRVAYWIPKGRSLVKKIAHQCPICKRNRAARCEQMMADLPRERVVPSRPFTHIGLDFAGPVFLREGKSTRKSYICLFVCMSTRAIHIELANDMSLGKFMECFRRMNARRGRCETVWSDNFRTFHAAAKGIKKTIEKIQKKAPEQLARRGFQWRFITERSPWKGGMYERFVRSVKTALRVVLGKSFLQYDEMLTVLTEVEQQINNRPITYLSDSHDDPEPLTPSHFLIGEQANQSLFRELKLPDTADLRRRWLHRERVMQHFWRRWRSEYLVELQRRTVWNTPSPNVKQGDVVLVQEDNQARSQWKLARVLDTTQGRDGLVRSAMLRTSKGNMIRRPVQRLHVLEAS